MTGSQNATLTPVGDMHLFHIPSTALGQFLSESFETVDHLQVSNHHGGVLAASLACCVKLKQPDGVLHL